MLCISIARYGVVVIHDVLKPFLTFLGHIGSCGQFNVEFGFGFNVRFDELPRVKVVQSHSPHSQLNRTGPNVDFARLGFVLVDAHNQCIGGDIDGINDEF